MERLQGYIDFFRKMPDAETEVNTKNSGYDYYTNVLGAPRLVLAPMVDQRYDFSLKR